MKIAAVAYIAREDGRMLCVWNKRYNGWTMPGGLVEDGETPEIAVQRELLEETGLCGCRGIFAIYDAPTEPYFNDGRGTYCYVFRVDAHGEPREREIGCPVTWFTREEFLRWCPFAKFYEKMFKTLEGS